MSAFILNEYHLSILGRAASAASTHSGRQIRTGYDAITSEMHAQTLYAENVRSVQYRYSESGAAPVMTFDSRAFRGILDPVQVIKAAHCYEYQACETPDYERSEAAKLIARIIAVYSRILPGYEAAQWEMMPDAR